ncbi:hypothetical protein CPB84DRAFT_794498 [Gymnopilus junonius]|uniref:SWIM-type domain-containing protein n=1 Tax=Gymnopilus junonius TaxID=109634 RepID=A0A9P5TGA3_GYMJU|nr:hypothetical protein CPB84DRAFT_794498 [Gymnopilus junonius]
MPYSCSFPAFVYSVLVSGRHIMCKHALASILVQKMCTSTNSICQINADDLATVFLRQFSLYDKHVDE